MKKVIAAGFAIIALMFGNAGQAHAQLGGFGFGYGGMMRGYDMMMGIGANVDHTMIGINHFSRNIQEGAMAGQIYNNAHMMKMQRDQMRENNIALTRCQIFNRLHHINQPCMMAPAYGNVGMN